MKKKFFQFSSEVLDFSTSSQAILTLFLEILLGFLAVIGSLFLFLKISHSVLDEGILSFDNGLIDFIYPLRTPLLTTFMSGITFLGGEIFLGLVIVATIMLLFRRYKKMR